MATEEQSDRETNGDQPKKGEKPEKQRKKRKGARSEAEPKKRGEVAGTSGVNPNWNDPTRDLTAEDYLKVDSPVVHSSVFDPSVVHPSVVNLPNDPLRDLTAEDCMVKNPSDNLLRPLTAEDYMAKLPSATEGCITKGYPIEIGPDNTWKGALSDSGLTNSGLRMATENDPLKLNQGTGTEAIFQNLQRGLNQVSASKNWLSDIDINPPLHAGIANSLYSPTIVSPFALGATGIDFSIARGTIETEDEASELRKKQLDLMEEVEEEREKAKKFKKNSQEERDARNIVEKRFERLQEVHGELEKKSALGNLRTQVNREALGKLLESDAFRAIFENTEACQAFVLAIDIRRSTELMLKAKDPKTFKHFIMGLCDGFRGIILRNWGIFDKFTGDGVLAFFSDFFCGENAGLMAVKSAIDCHEFFDK